MERVKIGTEVRNTEQVVNEINEIMSLLYIDKPIVLAGHSYGGLCAQHFVKEFPHKIAGIVLVDSTSVDLKALDELDLPVLNEDSTEEIWMEKCSSYSSMDTVELNEIIKPILTEKQKLLPPDIQKHLLEFQINPALYKVMYSEIKNWRKDADIIKGLSDFPNIPLVVIGRDKKYNIHLGTMEGQPESELRLLEDTWHKLILDQVNLSEDSELIIAQNSSHSIHIDRPDILISSIMKMNKR